MKSNNTSQWNIKIIANRFEECVSVFDRLPGEKMSTGAGFWPDIVYTENELSEQEKREKTYLRPLPEEITRAEEMLTWITWVNEGERNLIWLRAQRMSWRNIKRETGFPVTTARRYWTTALEKIIDNLKNQ